MTDSTHPAWFQWVTYLAIAWNLIGVLQFYAHISITPEQVAKLPIAQQELIASMPDWVNIAFAVAVFFGLFGSIALLMKKALALHLFLVSLLGVIVQNYYSFFMSNAIEVMGPAAIAVPASVFVIGVLLIVLSLKAKSQSWIS